MRLSRDWRFASPWNQTKNIGYTMPVFGGKNSREKYGSSAGSKATSLSMIFILTQTQIDDACQWNIVNMSTLASVSVHTIKEELNVARLRLSLKSSTSTILRRQKSLKCRRRLNKFTSVFLSLQSNNWGRRGIPLMQGSNEVAQGRNCHSQLRNLRNSNRLENCTL